jgi:hypothetical protein
MPRSGWNPYLLLLIPALLGTPLPALADSAEVGANASERLRQAFPGVRLLHGEEGQVRKVFGAPFSTGLSVVESAEAFRTRYADLFTVPAGDLLRDDAPGAASGVQPLMLRPETGTYKFGLVTYAQRHEGLPVFRADLRLLVRNEPGHPLVLATSALRDLRGFSVDTTLRERIDRPAYVEQRFGAARIAVLSAHPDLVNFGRPEVVIWAGTEADPADPRVALAFRADNSGPVGGGEKSRLFVTDLPTGGLLFEEDLIITSVVQGNVAGLATEGAGSDECEPEVTTPLPFLNVTSGTGSAFSDAAGDFSIQDGGATV